MKIDVSKKHNVQSKKYDYVRVAYILNLVGDSIPAHQINYYFNQIFPHTYSNSRRISMIIRQHPDLFSKQHASSSKIATLYSFKGSIILNKSTKHNWNKRSSSFFRTP